MAVATMSSSFAVRPRIPSAPIPSASLKRHSSLTATAAGASLSSSFPSTFSGGSVAGEFSGLKIGTKSLNPDSVSSSRGKRDVVTMVIPFSRGSAREQPPPDLATHLFQNRIVYLGMSLVPSVTELMVAELLYLQQQDDEKPIFLYINSAGTTKGGRKVGYEAQALAIYDVMGWVSAPIFTLCVGNAWGEAALLLAAGSKGNRSALPSATIMIKEPISRFQGQATDVEIARKEMRRVKEILVTLLARSTGKSEEQIAADIRRPKYFSPSEAVEYGIIDKVLYTERTPEDSGVVSDLKKANLI